MFCVCWIGLASSNQWENIFFYLVSSISFQLEDCILSSAVIAVIMDIVEPWGRGHSHLSHRHLEKCWEGVTAINVQCDVGSRALLQWLKLPAWKVGDRGFEPNSVLKFQRSNISSSPLTREDSLLWAAFVIER